MNWRGCAAPPPPPCPHTSLISSQGMERRPRRRRGDFPNRLAPREERRNSGRQKQYTLPLPREMYISPDRAARKEAQGPRRWTPTRPMRESGCRPERKHKRREQCHGTAPDKKIMTQEKNCCGSAPPTQAEGQGPKGRRRVQVGMERGSQSGRPRRLTDGLDRISMARRHRPKSFCWVLAWLFG